MSKYFAGRITLHTATLLADDETAYLDKLAEFMEQVRTLPAWDELITFYLSETTYASAEQEANQNA
jgi:hypothetical protein